MTQLYMLVLLLCLLPTINGRPVVKVILNNGIMPTPSGYECNQQDLAEIQRVIEGTTRRLETVPETIPNNERNLQTTRYRARCLDYCRGYTTGTCVASVCVGFRRRTNSKERRSTTKKTNVRGMRRSSQDEQHSRELTVCDDHILRVNQGLDDLLVQPTVTDSCKAVLRSYRDVSCFDEKQYAAIESFTLWNAETYVVIKENIQNGDTICYTPALVNIEASPNACVDQVKLRLTGPLTVIQYESQGPYTLFGGKNNNYQEMSGRTLPIGAYTIESHLDGSLTPYYKVSFSIAAC
jgi:hypothetical protein